MRRFFKARYVALLLANVLAIAILFSHSSVATLRARPARPEGRKVDPDSIALTARLERYGYELENDRTLLLTASGTGTVYLVKDDQTVLSGADVRFQLPKFGISGVMTPGDPGAYNYRIAEQIRITSPLPLLDTRGWQVRDLRIEQGGQDRTSRIALDERTASAFNFTRKDVAAAGLGLFRSPRSYSIRTETRLSFRVVQADGKPAANLTATFELPQRNYRETFSTDANGWVRIDRMDEILLTIAGGDLVTIDGPVVIYPPSDPATLFWWEDPTPRCDMDLRALDRRLAVKPGETARFGFEVVNLGNRPDNYTIRVEGLPESWVEVEYGGVVGILPFFGQTVYVNVTPERSPDTKMGTRHITFTASSTCGSEKSATADVKVQEFRAADVDIVGADLLPGQKVDPALRQEAREVGTDGMVTAILRSGSPLPDGARQEVESLGGLVRQQFGVIDGMSVQIPASRLDDLAKLGWVARLDQNKRFQVTLDRSVPATGAPELWNLGYTGAGVTVAVIDTGVDYTHPALAGHVVRGPDFAYHDNDPMDGHGHGTHVAGIIASQDQTRRGVAPGAKILAIKVLDDEGHGSDESVIAGVDWAVMHGADVINLSLGGPGGGGVDALAQAVDNAVKSGVVVVAAAGNSGPDFGTVGSPGDARLALTVGASDNERQLQSWSSRGPTLDGRQKPDVIAPGAGILSLAPGGQWQPMDGTSMATPHVAGLAALLLQATGAEPLLIKDALRRTALDLGAGPNNSGAGFVRPLAALEHLRRSVSLIQQEVFPGETAVYTISLTNRGNANDRFRVTHWFGENGLRYKSQSTLPGRSLRSIANTAIRSGESIDAQAEIRIDESWAGVEDAVYTFHIQATSMADRKATDADRATLKVKATKRSMAEYARLETADLREEIAAAAMDRATKSDLLARTDGLAAEERSAVEALAARDEAAANAYLAAAAAVAADMEAFILARQRAGAVEPEAAQSLIGRLTEIRTHLGLSQSTALR